MHGCEIRTAGAERLADRGVDFRQHLRHRLPELRLLPRALRRQQPQAPQRRNGPLARDHRPLQARLLRARFRRVDRAVVVQLDQLEQF